MAEVFTNTGSVAITTLAAGVASGVTSIPVLAAAPEALQGGSFRIEIDKEILRVTAGAATTTWTVERHLEGTTAASHSLGASVNHKLTAGGLVQGIKDYGGNVSEFVINAGTPTTTVAENAFVINLGSPGGSHGVFQMRHGFSTGSGKAPEWLAATTLEVGEPGFEMDTGKIKVGEEKSGGGLKKWSELTYWGSVALSLVELEAKYLHATGLTSSAIGGSPAAKKELIIYNPSTKLLEWGELPNIAEKAVTKNFTSTVEIQGSPTASGQVPTSQGSTAPYILKFAAPSGGVSGTPEVGRFPLIISGTTPEWVDFLARVTSRIKGLRTPRTASMEMEDNNFYEVETSSGTKTITMTLPSSVTEDAEGDLIIVELKTNVAGGKVIVKQNPLYGGPHSTYEMTNEGEVMVFMNTANIAREWRPIAYFSQTRGVVLPQVFEPATGTGILTVKLPSPYAGTIEQYENHASEVFYKRTETGAEVFTPISTPDVPVIEVGHHGDAHARLEIDSGGKINLGENGTAATDTTLQRGSRAKVIRSNGAISMEGLGGIGATKQGKGCFLGTANLEGKEPHVNEVAGLVYLEGDVVIDKEHAVTWVCYANGVVGGAGSTEKEGTLAKWRSMSALPNPYAASAGYVAQTFDASTLSALTAFKPTSGTLYLSKIQLPAGGPVPVASISVYMLKEGSELTYARWAVWNSAGELKAESKSLTTIWNKGGAGLVKSPSEGNPTVEGAFCWASILVTTSIGTLPEFGASPGIKEVLNGVWFGGTGEAKEKARIATNGAGLATLPASITPSANENKAGSLIYMALS